SGHRVIAALRAPGMTGQRPEEPVPAPWSQPAGGVEIVQRPQVGATSSRQVRTPGDYPPVIHAMPALSASVAGAIRTPSASPLR
ncbi:hypothetical protein, partial [Haematobacter massiliensis]